MWRFGGGSSVTPDFRSVHYSIGGGSGSGRVAVGAKLRGRVFFRDFFRRAGAVAGSAGAVTVRGDGRGCVQGGPCRDRAASGGLEVVHRHPAAPGAA